MSKLFLIGGAARVGKTSATLRLVARRPMFAASTDSVRAVIENILSEKECPELFKSGRGPINTDANRENLWHHPGVMLDYELGESEATWRSVLNYISYRDDRDLVFEGVAILPKNVVKLKLDYKAVFLVDLEDRTDDMLERAHRDSFDWLHKYDDETIRAYCHFSMAFNDYYFQQAKHYDLPVVTIDNADFESSIDSAVNILLAD